MINTTDITTTTAARDDTNKKPEKAMVITDLIADKRNNSPTNHNDKEDGCFSPLTRNDKRGIKRKIDFDIYRNNDSELTVSTKIESDFETIKTRYSSITFTDQQSDLPKNPLIVASPRGAGGVHIVSQKNAGTILPPLKKR
jgi:hypothetical protein